MIASLVGLAFGFLWLIVGAGALGQPAGWIAGTIGAAIFVLALIRIVQRRGRRGGTFIRSYYIAAVVGEVVAILIAQHWLIAHGRAALTFPVVGVIVGLHFIGLWLAMGLRRFVWLAGALVAINLAAIALPLAPYQRIALSGFGSAAALLLTAAA